MTNLHSSAAGKLVIYGDAYSALSRGRWALAAAATVTWCNCHERFTVRFSSSCWDLGWPSTWGLSPSPGGAPWPPRTRPPPGSIGTPSTKKLLEHSPAAHVRRPRLDYESHVTGLDRNELGALLVAAGLGPPAEHALISLLAMNGLRVSEAASADIQDLGVERGHRTLVVTRKGGKVVTIPLAPRTARAIDLAVGERTARPIFMAADGRWLDRHGAARIVRRVTCRAGIAKRVGPHTALDPVPRVITRVSD